jgi:recombination protein RecR
MAFLPSSVQNLIDELAKLPGIGPKTAERLAFYLLRSSNKDINALGQALLNLKGKIKTCSQCFNLSETDPCTICADNNRDTSKICVVEEPLDVLALEKTGEYKGLYHVLGGVISPIEGIGPDDLHIKEFLPRFSKNKNQVKEIILATNPSLEGEATAMYLKKLLEPLGIKLTRIARGLPIGAELEYADEITLSRALEGRKEY